MISTEHAGTVHMYPSYPTTVSSYREPHRRDLPLLVDKHCATLDFALILCLHCPVRIDQLSFYSRRSNSTARNGEQDITAKNDIRSDGAWQEATDNK